MKELRKYNAKNFSIFMLGVAYSLVKLKMVLCLSVCLFNYIHIKIIRLYNHCGGLQPGLHTSLMLLHFIIILFRSIGTSEDLVRESL